MQGSENINQLTHDELIALLHKAHEEIERMKSVANKSGDMLPLNVFELLSLAPDAFFQGDHNGKFLFCNDKAVELTGFTREELKSMFMSDLFDKEELASRPLRFDMLNEGKSIITERRLKRKDGSQVHVQMNSRRMPDGTYQSFIRDITERIIAENRIRESEETYRNLFQNAQVGLFRTRISDGQVLESNEQMARICGYEDREEFLREYKTSENYVDKGAREKMIEVIRKQGFVKNYEARYYKKDKTYFWGSFSARIHPEKGWIEGVLEEITDRKSALEALKNTEEKFSKAFFNSPDVMIITSPEDGRIIDVNDSIFRIAGYQPKELKGRSTIELNLWVNTEQRDNYINQLVKQGRVVNFEAMFRKSNGEVFTGLISGEFLRIENKRCVLSVIRNITERKKAEEQNRFLASILMYSNDFIGTASSGTEAIYVNQAGQKMLGLEGEDDVRRTRLEDYFFPEDLPFVHNTIFPALEKQGRWSGEFRFRHFKTGEAVDVLYDLFLTVEPETGKVINISTISRDITERKQQEKKLQLTEKRYRCLIEHAADGVVIINVNGEFEYISPSATKHFGYTEDEAIGKPGDQFTHPDDLPYVLNVMGQIMANPSLQPKISFRFRRKDGVYRWIETTFTNLLAVEGINGLVLNFTDITEKRQQWMRLEESESNLKVIIENSRDSIWAIGADYRVIYVNDVFVQAFEQAFGKRLEKGTNVIEALPHDLADVWKHRYDRVLANEQFVLNDCVVANENEFHIEVSFKPILVQDKVIGASVYARDITSKVRYEQDLINAKNKAEESERLKSVFLQNMSHEIRTPMNGIIGFLDLLKEPDLSEAEKEKYISIVEKSGQRLLNTINDIIEISKIEVKQVEVRHESMNIQDYMIYLRDFFNRGASAKGVELILDEYLIGNDALIVTDRPKFESICTNLLNNAVKFTEKGRISFGNKIIDGKLNFWVKDTGIGIPANRFEAVFDRFVQADLNITRPHEGSGLGLSITKAYVDMMGGSISVESEEGKGSVFSVLLPYTKAQETENEIVDKQPHVFQGNDKPLILLAEDDQTNLTVLDWMLVSEQFRVIKATSGRQAVALFFSTPDIALVLMDLKMPDMNGFEATRMIRQSDTRIPIIAQTAYALSGDRQKAMEAGCTDYLAKPIRKTDLISIIRKYIYP